MGCGTTLRVCQQLNRHAIGIDVNPEYVEMTRNRLLQPFDGFDSVDPRMERVPNDLRRPDMREEYLANHVKWFLSNHANAIDAFNRQVKEKYGLEIQHPRSSNDNQGELF